MIRWLQSSLMRDFIEEIRYINPEAADSSMVDFLNPALTLKFSGYSGEQHEILQNISRRLNFPFWKGREGREKEMIISFPNWNAVLQNFSAADNFPHHLKEELDILRNNIFINSWNYRLPGGRTLIIDRPLIMGILNVTPDSFSDGGQFFDPESALRHAMAMTEAGADIIDIGAESTRPGAGAVAMEEEWQRIEPVLRGLRKSLDIPLSVDTYKAEIARRSVAEGADIINDISGLTFDPEMAEIAAEADVPAVIMHIKGTPRNMQKHPTYENLMEEITNFFERQTKYAISSGIGQIILDPGLGFGKRFEDNYELIRRLGEFRAFGFPLLAGSSRKSFIGRVAGNTPLDKMLGTGAACAMAVSNGAHILRVHDVDEIQRIVKVSEAVRKNKA